MMGMMAVIAYLFAAFAMTMLFTFLAFCVGMFIPQNTVDAPLFGLAFAVIMYLTIFSFFVLT